LLRSPWELDAKTMGTERNQNHPPKEQNLRLLAWLSRISILTFVCHHFQPVLMAGTWITY
jgi:hypothetical protein